MRIIYDLTIRLYHLVAFILSVTGNEKAKLWLAGRKNFPQIQSKKNGVKRIWFHCASLGEFEQGRPLIEKVKADFPSTEIILTFFSPSGFEIRKNYSVASYIFYLPEDTSQNAKRFIESVQPDVAVFIKYEFWYHYLNTLTNQNIPVILASAIFREDQIFFKRYGSFFKKLLFRFNHIFVQNDFSKKLLTEAGIKNVSVAGDTRFDRVIKIRSERKNIPAVEIFSKNHSVIIAGSTWAEDENILLDIFMHLKNQKVKLIFAPHEVDKKSIDSLLERIISRNLVASLYSEGNFEDEKILIIDGIGLLSSLYAYGTIAWIGGGFGKGIHSTTEAAVYGIPVCFGPNYHKFNEAKELINVKGGFTIKDKNEGKLILQKLISEKEYREQCGQNASTYIYSNAGATEIISSAIGKHLS